jgi:hypothetical protein
MKVHKKFDEIHKKFDESSQNLMSSQIGVFVDLLPFSIIQNIYIEKLCSQKKCELIKFF